MTERAFGAMITQYERLVYTVCFQFTRDHHAAQDLTQETFLAAWRHIGSCPLEQAKPWLARIAANKAKDYLKSARYRREGLPDEELPDTGRVLFVREENPEDITLSRDTVAKIQNEILALKEPYHHVAVQYFIEQKTVEEIARLLDRPPKTVHTQLHRAKAKLQKTLKGGAPDG